MGNMLTLNMSSLTEFNVFYVNFNANKTRLFITDTYYSMDFA